MSRLAVDALVILGLLAAACAYVTRNDRLLQRREGQPEVPARPPAAALSVHRQLHRRGGAHWWGWSRPHGEEGDERRDAAAGAIRQRSRFHPWDRFLGPPGLLEPGLSGTDGD